MFTRGVATFLLCQATLVMVLAATTASSCNCSQLFTIGAFNIKSFGQTKMARPRVAETIKQVRTAYMFVDLFIKAYPACSMHRYIFFLKRTLILPRKVQGNVDSSCMHVFVTDIIVGFF